MALGARMEQRLRELGMTQSELARRVGTRQSTIGALVRRDARTTRHLFDIARELQTTAAYLTGATDDPSEAATRPRGSVPIVALPSEPELARLFEELLSAAELSTLRRRRIARLLAEQLPGRLRRNRITKADA